jgi:glycosyltransferase involved in cell wall biosynthesis
MEVIYIIESLSKKGGAENALVNLVIEMKKLGHQSKIVYLWGPNDFHEELQSYAIKTHTLKMKSRWSIFHGFWSLHKILSSSDIKIINAQNFFPMFYVALSKISIRQKKRIVTYHNMGYEVYPANNFIKLFRKSMDIFLNRFFFDGYLGVSNAVSSSYEKHLKINKINTIENIIPIDSINKTSSLISNTDNIDEFYRIIMAGRLVHEKGYKYIIDAVEILKSTELKFHLSIYGDGPLKSEIESNIADKKLLNFISIFPTVGHDELFNTIRKADLFVMSSISEGFPMAPAEAMVLGTPVIATKVGGIPELIEDGVSGILIPSRDSAKLAEQIKLTLNDLKLRNKLSINGRKRIDDEFSPTKICNKLLSYYSEILKK